MDFSGAFVRGSVSLIVLALLRQRTAYAYDMARIVARRSGGRLRWKEGSLYPALGRLERAGMISGQWKSFATASGKRRKRRYYSLTRAGRDEAKRQRKRWREFSAAVDTVLRSK